MTTADGGATWKTVSIPGQVAAPVFFNANDGATIASNQDGTNSIYVTADGGTSWRQTALAQPGATFAPSGFGFFARLRCQMRDDEGGDREGRERSDIDRMPPARSLLGA